jgi:hypothetical protein
VSFALYCVDVQALIGFSESNNAAVEVAQHAVEHFRRVEASSGANAAVKYY